MTLEERFRQFEQNASHQYIRLCDIRINSAIPNRPIDEVYIEQLRAAPSYSAFPPLDVMYMPNGQYYELLDGQHRWWAIIINIIHARRDRLPAPPSDADTAEGFAHHLKMCLPHMDDTMQSRVWPELSVSDVRLLRFWRNRDHGLGASEDDRKQMAIDLKRDNPLMTQEQIALEIRRSPAFVSKALKQTNFQQDQQERHSDPYKDTKKFCDIVEKIYYQHTGFFRSEQISTREQWLRNDARFRKAYEETARQMLKEIEKAKSKAASA